MSQMPQTVPFDCRRMSAHSMTRHLLQHLRRLHDQRMTLLALLAPSRLPAAEREEVLASFRAETLRGYTPDMHDKATTSFFSGTGKATAPFSPGKAIRDAWDLCAPYFPIWGHHQLSDMQCLQRIRANRGMFYTLVFNLLLESRAICQNGGDIHLAGEGDTTGISFTLSVAAPELCNTDWMEMVLHPQNAKRIAHEPEVRILYTTLTALGGRFRAERMAGSALPTSASEKDYAPETFMLHIWLPADNNGAPENS